MPFREGLRAWVLIAATSFGGPAGQIAVIHRVVVDERKWVDERSFLNALGYCMLLPGPEAQQLVTYIGWRLHGVRGGLAAGGLFILPGFLSILALSVLYVRHGDSQALQAIFYGLKPAVIAIVLEAVLRLRKRAIDGRATATVAAAAFVAIFALGVPFPLIVAGSALVGAAALPDGDGGRERAGGAAVPARAVYAPVGRPAATALVWLGIWGVPVVALVALLGPGHVLGVEALFFSKVAVVTFGGAYAVLSYVAEQAVELHGWLDPREMLDGLGLAETTPGPLIQVVQFVGFLGAYRNAGGMDPLAMGLLGSLVTTWVTFAPCFLFIFAGAPFIERIQDRPRLRGALAGITAAVLGVVVNLALWFAIHTLFRESRVYTGGPLALELPVWSSLDPWAALIGLLTAALALRYRAGMAVVLGVGVAVGLVLRGFG